MEAVGRIKMKIPIQVGVRVAGSVPVKKQTKSKQKHSKNYAFFLYKLTDNAPMHTSSTFRMSAFCYSNCTKHDVFKNTKIEK